VLCCVVACRQKQKSLLDGVVSQREALQQRLYQAEVQVCVWAAFGVSLGEGWLVVTAESVRHCVNESCSSGCTRLKVCVLL
jgi:hypothetical protein